MICPCPRGLLKKGKYNQILIYRILAVGRYLVFQGGALLMSLNNEWRVKGKHIPPLKIIENKGVPHPTRPVKNLETRVPFVVPCFSRRTPSHFLAKSLKSKGTHVPLLSLFSKGMYVLIFWPSKRYPFWFPCFSRGVSSFPCKFIEN